MHVEKLWRYPVKSLGGEALDYAELTTAGIAGDRTVHVRNDGGLLTARTRKRLVTVATGTGSDGVPSLSGHPWHSPAAADLVRAAGGPDTSLAAYSGPERFDVLNLLVATDGAVSALGEDIRRLRPNMLIGGVAPDAERQWPGRALVIGDAVVGVHSLRQRCVVTSIDPDTGERNAEVFERIRREFNGKLALNCWVIHPGTIHVGDRAHLVANDEVPSHVGGWVVGAAYRPDGPPDPTAAT